MTDDLESIDRSSLVLLCAVFTLGIGLVLGYVVTPYVHGEPLLLTPSNRMVKEYLDNYTRWLTRAEQERATLVTLLAPSRPGASAKSVFDRSTQAREAQNRLNDLVRQVEQMRIPAGLVPLDQALRNALAGELDLADQTLMFVGRADETTRVQALAASDDVRTKLENARQALGDAIGAR